MIGQVVARVVGKRLAVLLVGGAALAGLLLLSIAFGGSIASASTPWNGGGHCQLGAQYGPPLPQISMTEGGRLYRQCNDGSTASHGTASGTFTVYRTTGSVDFQCNTPGTKCGYRWYLGNNGWVHCSPTTGSC